MTTDLNSPSFIPGQDRLAVFDLYGTRCGEQYPICFEWMMYVQRVLGTEAHRLKGPTPGWSACRTR